MAQFENQTPVNNGVRISFLVLTILLSVGTVSLLWIFNSKLEQAEPNRIELPKKRPLVRRAQASSTPSDSAGKSEITNRLSSVARKTNASSPVDSAEPKENSTALAAVPVNDSTAVSQEYIYAGFSSGGIANDDGSILRGTITLKGTPPPEKVNDMLKNDPLCGKVRDDIPKTRLYVVGTNGGLADTVVYIKEGLAGKSFEAPSTPVVLDQILCEYQPYILALQTNQKLLIKNSEQTIMHNVHVTPKAAGNRESNQAQMAKGKDIEKKFGRPELFITFRCDVHPWMFAYVNVFENPYFAVSDDQGRFQIKGLPPGKYVVEAFHRKAGKITQEITVQKDQNQNLEFALQLPENR